MTRLLGAIVAVLVVAGSAAADKPKTPAPKPAAKAGDKTARPDKAGDPAQPGAADAEAGSAEHEPTPAELEAALPPHITGPKLVDLGNDSELALPEGMILFERAQAQELVRKGGDNGEGVLAVVLKPGADWAVVIHYQDVGYVTDSDADQLDASELLESYKKGTADQNERRRAMGVPDLIIDGWSEKPRYEKTTHQLLWGLDAHDANGKIINFITRTLGRNGFLSIDLIDAPDKIAQSKTEAAAVIAGTRFKSGARYEDHKSEDKSSGMGLRALVLGGAGIAVLKVAKAGIFLKLLLIFKKGFIVVFAAIGGFFKWLFRRKNSSLDLPPTDAPPTGAPPTDVPPPTDPNVG